MDLPNQAAVTMQDRSWQFYYENKTVLTLSVTYPVISVPGARWVQERINRSIQSQVSDFYRYASGKLYRIA